MTIPNLSALRIDDGGVVGECQPVGNSRVQVVYVALKEPGDLTRADLDQIAEFAKAAAVAASRMERQPRLTKLPGQ